MTPQFETWLEVEVSHTLSALHDLILMKINNTKVIFVKIFVVLNLAFSSFKSRLNVQRFLITKLRHIYDIDTGKSVQDYEGKSFWITKLHATHFI